MTQPTFFFYDLETSGTNPRKQRIMQFAGQRTDMDLQPIGEPVNVLVRLSDEVLPEPEAIMITGITPQKTVEEGYSEVEFCKIVQDDVFTPGTIVTGFNSVRFDDEFMRYTFYRNFYDPYEWSWKDDRSRWDLLDVVRLTRALRPEGINWPFNEEGKPVNRLELLTKENNISHVGAHDALSDVNALIEVTKLIRNKQPKLFEYLLKMRDKKEVQKLVSLDDKKPFVYATGRYDQSLLNTSVAFPLTAGANGNVVVYDLRHDPTPFLNLSVAELKAKLFASWEERKADGFVKVPVKELAFNRVPAVAPLGVLGQDDGWQKLGLTQEIIEKHMQLLLSAPQFAENVRSAVSEKPSYEKNMDVDAQLYDGFLPDGDKAKCAMVRGLNEQQLDFSPEFRDERLQGLFLRYKARNFPKSLNEQERAQWETYHNERIIADLPGFMKQLQDTAKKYGNDESKQYLLSELQLWAESITPESE